MTTRKDLVRWSHFECASLFPQTPPAIQYSTVEFLDRRQAVFRCMVYGSVYHFADSVFHGVLVRPQSSPSSHSIESSASVSQHRSARSTLPPNSRITSRHYFELRNRGTWGRAILRLCEDPQYEGNLDFKGIQSAAESVL